MLEYGLISKLDWTTIERSLNIVFDSFPQQMLWTFEIGVNDGRTSRAIRDYVHLNKRVNIHFAVDNQQDFEMASPYDGCMFIIGDSVQVCHKFANDFFHFGFIDANHSFHRVIADFVAYASKIKKGGLLLFHDTKPGIERFKDYQKVGSDKDERMYINVRQALKAIGLMDGVFPEWELVMDEYDIHNAASGICVFKKL